MLSIVCIGTIVVDYTPTITQFSIVVSVDVFDPAGWGSNPGGAYAYGDFGTQECPCFLVGALDVELMCSVVLIHLLYPFCYCFFNYYDAVDDT